MHHLHNIESLNLLDWDLRARKKTIRPIQDRLHAEENVISQIYKYGRQPLEVEYSLQLCRDDGKPGNCLGRILIEGFLIFRSNLLI